MFKVGDKIRTKYGIPRNRVDTITEVGECYIKIQSDPILASGFEYILFIYQIKDHEVKLLTPLEKAML